MPGTLKIRDTATGMWEEISTAGPMGQRGPAGPLGPTGPTGPQGISSVIIGDFGATTTPASLPPDGLISVDWDGPGNPAEAFQVELGQSLYYDKPSDAALDGHLYQYVGTGVDPAGWLDIGLIQGPVGPLGPTGPTGPMTDEVHIGPDDPPLVQTELWFDTDDNRILGPVSLPTGGLTGQPLLKKTDLDGDMAWGGLLQQEQQANFDGHVYLNSNIYPVGTFQQPVKWGNAEGDKIYLYPGATAGSTSFGFGIAASTLVAFVPNDAWFKIRDGGGHDGGDEILAVNSGTFNYMGNRVATSQGWVSQSLPAGISGSAHARRDGNLISIKFSINKAGATVGDNVMIFDVNTWGGPAQKSIFAGTTKEDTTAMFWMATSGQVYTQSGCGSQDLYGTFVYPLD